jgi:hypothetical protein
MRIWRKDRTRRLPKIRFCGWCINLVKLSQVAVHWLPDELIIDGTAAQARDLVRSRVKIAD